jgi:ferredoxin/flavodoxin---NADP+ reductase
MFEVLERKMIVPNLHLLVVRAPEIAEGIMPGQFVIIHDGKGAERIPLSIADFDRKEGTLSIIFMEVGVSTGKLAMRRAGDSIPSIVGPLGRATEIQKFGTVVCIGGCYGVGTIYPIARALKEAGNRVIMLVEGRSKNLLFWEEKHRTVCDELISITRDGSYGHKGHVKTMVDLLRGMNAMPDRIIANGCTTLVYKTTQDFTHLNIPIIVSLNTIMIDGTGMCGVCRVTVDGKMKFACVDGPDFDGRLVDWDELSKRRRQYLGEEAYLLHNSGCSRK